MIYYLRQFLLWIRRQENTSEGKYKFRHKAIASAVVLSLISLVVDRFIPFNPIINTFRGILAIAIGSSLFSYIYVKLHQELEKRMMRDIYYNPVRHRFSYRQRKNITILGIFITISILILMPGDGRLYTIISSIGITIILLLLTFMRTYREEHSRIEQGALDIRDIEFRVNKNKEEKSIDD